MVYAHDDYKALIKSTLLARKANVSPTYTFQNLAKACKVQKTYLSKVFNGDAHLSSDQIFLACQYLGYNSNEQNYVQLLHQKQRSAVEKQRQQIQEKLLQIRQSQLKSESRLEVETYRNQSSDHSEQYYLDTRLPLIHMCLTIERFRTRPMALAHALGIEHQELTRLLVKLEKMAYIRFDGTAYQVLRDAVHLGKDSPLYQVYRNLMRLKTLQRLDGVNNDQTYNFSVMFSADDETHQQIQAHFLEFLERIQHLVRKAPAERVYQLGFDLFPWT